MSSSSSRGDLAAAAVLGAGIAVTSAIVYARFAADVQSSPPAPSATAPTATPFQLSKQRSYRAASPIPRNSERDKRIERICLTGGPCGGKSSCLKGLIDRLREQGINVFIAPEMPTVLRRDCECPFPFKPNPTAADVRHMLLWEGKKMQLQADVEDALYDIAKSSGRRSVILCDRGLPDSAAYVSEDDFQTILDEHDFVLDKLMARYSLVIHLESAAIDTSLYNQFKANNVTRTETESEAREQDLKTQRAWASHPNMVMVRNRESGEDFAKKETLAVNHVLEHLGLAAASSAVDRRIFLLRCHPPSSAFDDAGIKCDSFSVESTFLRQTGEDDRVLERRGRTGFWTYSLSKAYSIGNSTNSVDQLPGHKKYIDKVRIGGEMYTGLLAEADSTRQVVRRKERVFTHHVPTAGRDVVHRLVEVVGSSSGTQGINLEFLHVDGLEPGFAYEPPGFLVDVIDKEVVEQDEKDKFSLRALSEIDRMDYRRAVIIGAAQRQA